MNLKVDIRCSAEERQLLERAITEANQVLARLWAGIGPKYHVSYIELGSERLDEASGEMVAQPLQYLAAEVAGD